MGGRAGFDVMRSAPTKPTQPEGPHNVIPGNLGERAARIGAMKSPNRSDREILYRRHFACISQWPGKQAGSPRNASHLVRQGELHDHPLHTDLYPSFQKMHGKFERLVVSAREAPRINRSETRVRRHVARGIRGIARAGAETFW